MSYKAALMGISPVHLGTQINWLDFESKRSKVKVTARPHYGQISTLGGIFSAISGMRGHILMKRITIILVTRSIWHWCHFKVMSSKIKATDKYFSENALFRCWRHSNWRVSVEDRMLSVILLSWSTDMHSVTLTPVSEQLLPNVCEITSLEDIKSSTM